MQDIANSALSGNLTRDVELRQLPSGADVARLRLATTTRRRNGEDWIEKTNYFTIEVFGGQARACAQYLSKGSRVFIDAEPDWREWADQQGNKREAVTFKARYVLFESGRPPTATAQARPRRPLPPRSPDPPQPHHQRGEPRRRPPTICRSEDRYRPTTSRRPRTSCGETPAASTIRYWRHCEAPH